MIVSTTISYGQQNNLIVNHGFAHNDYLHDRPVFDALDNGYVKFEADIFLKNNKLVVAHWFPYFKGNKTLDSLYLLPLSKIVARRLADSSQCTPITLLIDIKSDPNKTYKALSSLLQKYSNILSSVENGIFKQREISIIITGRKPVKLIKEQLTRYVMIDDNLLDSDNERNESLYAMSSCKYSKLLNWNGEGRITMKEKAKLITFVNLAHKQGKKVRLWASPENKNVWAFLLQCNVDYIHTDKLVELKDFLFSDTP